MKIRSQKKVRIKMNKIFFAVFLLGSFCFQGCSASDTTYQGLHEGLHKGEEFNRSKDPSKDPVPIQKPSYHDYKVERDAVLKEHQN